MGGMFDTESRDFTESVGQVSVPSTEAGNLTAQTTPGGLFDDGSGTNVGAATTASGSAELAKEYAEDAKGWAIGTDEGSLNDWSDTNNSKYYSDEAEEFKDLAQTAANNAAASANNAAASATAAAGSASNAAASAELAEMWAIDTDTDTFPAGGSKYWAKVAEAAAADSRKLVITESFGIDITQPNDSEYVFAVDTDVIADTEWVKANFNNETYTAGYGLLDSSNTFSVDTDIIADTDWVLGNVHRSDHFKINVDVGENVASAPGQFATAIGPSTTATNNGALALGNASNATGVRSVAIGDRANAEDSDSLAMGDNALASVEEAVSVGSNTVASGERSVALGAYVTASGTEAVAIGAAKGENHEDRTIASGANSLAIGAGAEASGSDAIAIGEDAEATQQDAIAIGDGANADHLKSIALGGGATTDTEYQLVVNDVRHIRTPDFNANDMFIRVDTDGVWSLHEGTESLVDTEGFGIILTEDTKQTIAVDTEVIADTEWVKEYVSHHGGGGTPPAHVSVSVSGFGNEVIRGDNFMDTGTVTVTHGTFVEITNANVSSGTITVSGNTFTVTDSDVQANISVSFVIHYKDDSDVAYSHTENLTVHVDNPWYAVETMTDPTAPQPADQVGVFRSGSSHTYIATDSQTGYHAYAWIPTANVNSAMFETTTGFNVQYTVTSTTSDIFTLIDFGELEPGDNNRVIVKEV